MIEGARVSKRDSDSAGVSGSLLVGSCIKLTPEQKISSVAVIEQQLTKFGQRIERYVQAKSALIEAANRASLKNKLKEGFSKAKAGLGNLLAKKPEPLPQTERDRLDNAKLLRLKEGLLVELFRQYNDFLMNELNACYIYVAESSAYPQLRLVLDADNLICFGDVRSALVELKLLVLTFVKAQNRLAVLKEANACLLMADALQSRYVANSGGSADPRSVSLSPWNRQLFFRPGSISVDAELQELKAPLIDKLSFKFRYLISLAVVRVGDISTELTPDDRDKVLERKKEIFVSQMNRYLKEELESPYLGFSPNFLMILNQGLIKSIGDIWFLAREVRLLAHWVDNLFKSHQAFLDYETHPGVREENSKQFKMTFSGLALALLQQYEQLSREQLAQAARVSSEQDDLEGKLDDGLESVQPAADDLASQLVPVQQQSRRSGLHLYQSVDDDQKESTEDDFQPLDSLVMTPSVQPEASILGSRPEKPDLSVKLLVFGRVWALTSSLSFWSLLQGKTGKIKKARYGLDLLKALLMDLKENQPYDEVSLLRDVTDVLFSHRISRVQASESGEPTDNTPTRSGEKFANFLLEQRNAYLRHLIFESIERVFLINNVFTQDGYCSWVLSRENESQGEEGNFIASVRPLLMKHRRAELGPADLRCMIKLLMAWCKLKYFLDNYRSHEQAAVTDLSNRFFANNRTPRALLARTDVGNRLIKTMRQEQKNRRGAS